MSDRAQNEHPLIRISQKAQFVLDSRNSILSYEASGALHAIILEARALLNNWPIVLSEEACARIRKTLNEEEQSGYIKRYGDNDGTQENTSRPERQTLSDNDA